MALRAALKRASKLDSERIRHWQRLNSDIMTAPEVADFLKMHLKTIYKLADSGELPGVKVGRNWRFQRSLIRKLFESRGGESQ